MSERKVINKYFPPDYDPSKISRKKKAPGGSGQQTIRLMAPFSMRCSSCGEYIYKGKKFNARKETAKEEYMGLKIFRFYIKCTLCSAEITFKTDPKNADYVCEHGAKRNFENWIESNPNGDIGALPTAAADDLDPDAPDPDKDAMALLETSQEQSKREMEEMDELADLRSRNARMERRHADPTTLDPATILAALHDERATAAEEARLAKEQEEDDLLVSKHFAKIVTAPGEDNGEPVGVVKRATEKPTVEALIAAKEKEKAESKPKPMVVKKRKDMAAALGIKVVKKPKV